MAEIVIKRVICDLHLQTSAEHVDGEKLPPLMIDGRLLRVDLCDPCKTTISYTEMVELAKIAGHEVEPPKSSTSRRRPGPPEPETERSCRFCSRVFDTIRGRKRHEQFSHEALWNEAEGIITSDDEDGLDLTEASGEEASAEEEESEEREEEGDEEDDVEEPEGFYCPVEDCERHTERPFESRQGLNNHMRRHSAEERSQIAS